MAGKVVIPVMSTLLFLFLSAVGAQQHTAQLAGGANGYTDLRKLRGQFDVGTGSVEECCDRIYLRATGGAVEANQWPLLGLYNFTGMRDDRPYYSKEASGTTFYFYYEPEGTVGLGSPGWTLGMELNGEYLHVSTRDTDHHCPEGIRGAFDQDRTWDASFAVECHSDVVRGDGCCVAVRAEADGDGGAIAANQSPVFGRYVQVGVLNGHPLFKMQQEDISFYLYFRKRGGSSDGWTISLKQGGEAMLLTTRNMEACPGGINTAYDRDRTEDTTFRIRCDDGGGVLGSATPPSPPEASEVTGTKTTTTAVPPTDAAQSPAGQGGSGPTFSWMPLPLLLLTSSSLIGAKTLLLSQ